jgi:hypothetical protein
MVAALGQIRSLRSPSSFLMWMQHVLLFFLFATPHDFAVAKKVRNGMMVMKTKGPKEEKRQRLRVITVAQYLESLKKRQEITGGAQNIAGVISNATVLAQKLAGGGTNITNASFLFGSNQQFGVFTGGANSINISEGIVISTGNAQNVNGRFLCQTPHFCMRFTNTSLQSLTCQVQTN